MQYSFRKTAPVLAFALAACAIAVPIALGKKKEKREAPGRMEESKRASHALNRLTFGPRPGDLEQVSAMGVEKWIELQLHPEKLDDSALEVRLAPLRTLRMDTREMAENFPPEQLIKAIAEGKDPLPSDSVKRAIYQAQLVKYEEKQERKQEAANSAATKPQTMAPETMAPDAATADATAGAKAPVSDDDMERRRETRLESQAKVQELAALPPEKRLPAILKMSAEDQRALAASLKGDRRDLVLAGMDPKQRETVMALNNPQQVVTNELVQGKLLHAVYGERQLQEVMDDFWLNHFNVFLGKGADRYMLTSYERDVIRPHSMGKFEDLLVATAQSPAMLFYLDNWLSVGPNSDYANGIRHNGRKKDWSKHNRNGAPVKQSKGKRSGLNENYGRELMELHTLGVNGGYAQTDVTEVARVFTGWTLKQPREGGGFSFEDRMHEPGDKTVLGHKIKSNGQKEGFEVLHLLARHPSTAKFVCNKLAMRFVSDNPPPALVEHMAETFLKKDGDIREVLRTMFASPEFWAPEAYRAKVKTPLEFVASAVRASGADVTDAMPLVRQLQNMGMPLYGMQPPTGYSMKAETWVNSSALLGRMNFALALTSGKMKGVQVDTGRVAASGADAGDPQQLLALLENSLLAGDVSKQTHDTIAARLNDPKITQRKLDDPARAPDVGMIAGLLLGSPEFQRR